MKILGQLFVALACFSIVASVGGCGKGSLGNQAFGYTFDFELDDVNAKAEETTPDIILSCKDPQLCEVEKEEIPARVLENDGDKPDDVHPRYASFRFKGVFWQGRQNSEFRPNISIYRISEFRSSLAKSSVYSAEFDKQLGKLQRLFVDEPSVVKGEMPFLRFVDAEQPLSARLSYKSFNGGRGVLYLTQFNTEPSLINNDGLTLMFQALTDDNEFYILATFPIKTKMLPDGYDAVEFENYQLPDSFYEPKRIKANELNYRNYIRRIQSTLEGLKPEDFDPNPNVILDLLGSLKIKRIYEDRK